MDLQESALKVDWWKGREIIKQYTSILKEKRTAEDVAIIRSTKAILAGKMVVRLADVVKAGGTDVRGMPRLAVARADDTIVRCKSWRTSCQMVGMHDHHDVISDYRSSRGSWWGRIRQASARGFTFTFAGQHMDVREARAMVPSIPPAHRPTAGSLSRYYILFEANWEPEPPVDPALLAPLGAGMYVVVAVWDLTDVERAALAHARGA